jgi:hypothetical protein
LRFRADSESFKGGKQSAAVELLRARGKSAAHEMGSKIDREIMRGVLGWFLVRPRGEDDDKKLAAKNSRCATKDFSLRSK